jgi:DNA-binding NarL/FixJ family response regulator
MATWTMRQSDTERQDLEHDLVTVLLAAPRGSAGFDDPAPDIDLVERPPGPDIDIVGRVHTGTDAVESVLDIMPDVLVIDSGIDNGVEDISSRAACRRVQEWAPATRILAVAPDDGELLYTTVAAGASSALTVDRVGTHLADAANRLARGESLLPARVAHRLLSDLDKWAARSSDPLYPPPALTSTEREVLAHLGAGDEPSEIAKLFGVTSHLVNLHAGYAVAKLHRFLSGAEQLTVVGR